MDDGWRPSSMCCWRLIVTIDVLLKKSDVRCALGWIGAVWLAPIFGSLLYYPVRHQPGDAPRPEAEPAGRRPGQSARPRRAGLLPPISRFLSEVSERITAGR